MEIIIRSKVEKYIYSSSEDELENVILDLMTQNNFTLSVAESCTGGLIANRLTNISNSSKYFLQGIVAYSNQSKINLLQIDKSILEEFGAVSQEVAEAMAIQSKIFPVQLIPFQLLESPDQLAQLSISQLV